MVKGGTGGRRGNRGKLGERQSAPTDSTTISERYTYPVLDRYGRNIEYSLASPELLIGLLITHGQNLPDYLLTALIENLQRQLPDDGKHHIERWSLMLHAVDEMGMSWDEAPVWVSKELKRRGQPPASSGTVMRSYNKIEAERRKLGRGRPRTYRKAR